MTPHFRGVRDVMTHRAFADARGDLWQVWDVVPQWADRRAGDERRFRALDDPDVDPPVLEQRQNPDRRQGLPDEFPRIKLTDGLVGGWLSFESAGTRRRLSPIPSGWEDAADAELEEMCRRAAPAVPSRRPSH